MNEVISIADHLQDKKLSDPTKSLPDFISPDDIPKMSDSQLEQLVNVLQLRRLQSTHLYESTLRARGEITMSKARESLEHKAGQVSKELKRTITAMDKLELRVNELRALRIQCGLTWDP
jgi:hypothetical protein